MYALTAMKHLSVTGTCPLQRAHGSLHVPGAVPLASKTHHTASRNCFDNTSMEVRHTDTH